MKDVKKVKPRKVGCKAIVVRPRMEVVKRQVIEVRRERGSEFDWMVGVWFGAGVVMLVVGCLLGRG